MPKHGGASRQSVTPRASWHRTWLRLRQLAGDLQRTGSGDPRRPTALRADNRTRRAYAQCTHGRMNTIFDHLGPWFTLAGFGKQPSEALVAAATRRGLPLKVMRFEEPELTRVYGRQLLLVRPDQHIAWRGLACDSPRDADAIITRALGWENSSQACISNVYLDVLPRHSRWTSSCHNKRPRSGAQPWQPTTRG